MVQVQPFRSFSESTSLYNAVLSTLGDLFKILSFTMFSIRIYRRIFEENGLTVRLHLFVKITCRFYIRMAYCFDIWIRKLSKMQKLQGHDSNQSRSSKLRRTALHKQANLFYTENTLGLSETVFYCFEYAYYIDNFTSSQKVHFLIPHLIFWKVYIWNGVYFRVSGFVSRGF